MSKSSRHAAKKKGGKSKEPLRILVKCSWNGVRLPANDASLNTSSTISDIISSISSSLPAVITSKPNNNEQQQQEQEIIQPSVVYMRMSILQQNWDTTTIKKLLGQDVHSTGGGSILLTLNLPSSKNISTLSPPAAAAAVSTSPTTPPKSEVSDSTAQEVSVPVASVSLPVVKDDSLKPNLESSKSEPVPMEIDSEETSSQPPSKDETIMTSDEAVKLLLTSNFDSDSIESIKTLLKIIDNIISNPTNEKVRSLKMSNAAVQRKIFSKKGGLEILLSIGFDYVYPPNPVFEFASAPAVGVNNQKSEAEAITLKPDREDMQHIIAVRQKLAQVLIKELSVPSKEVPTMKQPASTTAMKQQAAVKFDPFKSQAFNSQAAAVGAPNPNSIIPDGGGEKSKTERQLELLKNKKTQLERQMQQKSMDRGIVAFLPGTNVDSAMTMGAGGGRRETSVEEKSDASLLAGHMKRQEEERKKREEGGFTTRAMRDLEKMKKAKVYSHAQLRIHFPDGCKLSANFLPKETIAVVKELISSTLLPELQSEYKFDVYVAPPRRTLITSNTLVEEDLVPAAKIHVSWKNGPPPGSKPGSFLQNHFFHKTSDNGGKAASAMSTSHFPDSKPLTEEAKDKRNANEKKAATSRISGSRSAASKEEELIQRMMGKRKGFLGKKSGAGKKKDGGGKGR